MYALAEKVAAALAPSQSFSIELNDISAKAPVELAGIRQIFEADLTARGDRSAAPASADALVHVTVSQDIDGYLLVAEIHRGETQQVAIAPVAKTEEASAQLSPVPGIARKIIWQQSRPILDFAQAATDASHTYWYFLEPDRLVVYEFNGGAQVLGEARPISKLYTSRDLRGRLVLDDATHVKAFIGGVRCETVWNPSFALECHENPGQQWPMGQVSWPIDPSKNFFSGNMAFANSLEEKFPAFYSAASPSQASSSQSTSRWAIAGLDGQVRLFEGAAEPVSTFAGWGSDIASVAPACGLSWQVLAAGPGDWTQPDQLQLYEILSRRAIAVGQPMQASGPILALWSADDGKSARMISRNLDTGLYEASIVSISCGN
ncbi:MAG TPA: hypothetical protein VJO53_13760 [Candidatus Acidoferrales bacterium]|nr:hypothetical protein [Candidatus Acidoferrales bacterium]